MTTRSEVVSTPFRAFLNVGGEQYVLTALSVTYAANQIPTANVDLAVGFRGDKSGGTGASEITARRGTPATITMELDQDITDPISGTELARSGEVTIFNGLLDDSAPGNLSHGSFNIRARLLSKQAVLNTGTLQLSKLIPRSFIDSSIAVSPSNVHLLEVTRKGSFKFSGLQADFWKELARIFKDIATVGQGRPSKSLQEYVQIFGGDVNTAAADIVSSIAGSLIPGSNMTTDVMQNLKTYLDDLFVGDFRMESFYSRIINLGQEFKFRLVESFSGMKVVPFSPFFASDTAVSVYPSTFVDANWENREPNSIEGAAIILTGPQAHNAVDRQPHIIGGYKRPLGGTPLGSIPAIPAPSWLMGRSKAGNRQISPAVSATIANAIGKSYAKETAFELAYRGSTMNIVCPLRMDLGLFTPVKIIYPQLSGVGLGPAVYGSVQGVRIEASARDRRVGTILEIGYVRSQTLQDAEFEDYQHPLWSEQYGGGRLDD